MTFGQRLGYFSGGLIIGIFFLIFFLAGKKTSCDYSPTARVLKNIRIKERQFTPQSLEQLNAAKLDTAAISKILNSGSVNFSKSNTKLDSCKLYHIDGVIKNKSVALLVENCNKQAKITHIETTKLPNSN
ncbi:hypothetical protein [Aquimarina agarivorans]|uniref:hypothetical protein n=1 Tax=Aquimarina agarivorans TaxID=980584 RepID=UPI000248EA2A|nr:hypothetical protein [Aquimarina agarivorans]